MKKITKIPPNNDFKLIQPKLKVAAYCRVSTDMDDQLVSLETQKIHYESYIKANPQWEFAGVYYDEGISGTKKEKRAALLKLIKDCEKKKVDFIITKSISRFARNTTDCLEIVRKLVDIGVFIYFEKENINTESMESELMLTILSSLAESESISISQNATWSIQKRFQNGTYKISYPPYGYKNVDGVLTIDEEAAKIIKQIFASSLAGNGAYKIANQLNAENAPTKKGGKWSASSVAAILRNDTYTGDVRLQKTFTDSNFNRHVNRGKKDQYIVKNHHESIISHEDFEAVAKTMRLRGKEKGIEKGASKYLARYPFSSKIKCSECGSNFKRRVHTNGESKYIAWSCSKHLTNIEDCSMRFIYEESIHQAFVVMINKLVYGYTQVLKPLLQSLKAVNYSENIEQIQLLENQIESNNERSQVLVSLMTKGYLEPALFNEQNNALLQEAALLKEKTATLASSINGDMSSTSEVEHLLKFVLKQSMQESFDEVIFDRFVDSIIVFSQKEIGFKMKCGLTLRERMMK